MENPHSGDHAEGAPASRPPTSRRNRLIGTTIEGRYLIEAVLGEGAMGTVYSGLHTGLGRRVAVKVLHDEFLSDTEVVGRFSTEARAACAIGNEHIVNTLDFGVLPEGSMYLVMEHLEGVTLGALLKGRGPLAFEHILLVVRQVAAGLDAAHRAGVVHRDLKPDNILIVKGGDGKPFIKILDFGIAKLASTQKRITRAGQVFGTPHYMSPEQAAGEPTDARSDIYSLGVMLYELASGRVPFDAEGPMQVLSQHLHSEPPPLASRLPKSAHVPDGFEQVVARCLEKTPTRRYQSVADVLHDLENVERGLGAGSAPPAVLTEPLFASVPPLRVTNGDLPSDSSTEKPYFSAPTPKSNPHTSIAPVALSVDAISSPMHGPVPPPPASDRLAGTTHRVAFASEPSPEEIAALRPRGRFASAVVRTLALLAVGVTGAFLAVILREPRDAATAAAAATVYVPVPTPAESAYPPGTTHVNLIVFPLDAHAFRGEEDLGATPVVVHLLPGKTDTLVLRRTGFETQRVKIDGKTARVIVNLRKWPRAPAADVQVDAPRPAASGASRASGQAAGRAALRPIRATLLRPSEPRSKSAPRREGSSRPTTVEAPRGQTMGRR